MSQTTTDTARPLLTISGQHIITKIKNMSTKLFITDNTQPGDAVQKTSLTVASPNFVEDHYQTWKLVLIDDKNQHYYITNVYTNNYAYIDQPTVPGTNVAASLTKRGLWQVSPVTKYITQDRTYTISPVGDKLGEVFWTNEVPLDNEPIKIELQESEKSTWIIESPDGA
ncbi:hypothetical protein BC629DRAFT_267124 [Irpex lacteus]|nr:hypothetical protein BC629DRAFT_267124 [Irpex lacteus]